MFNYESYLRLDKFPLIWCSGCGDGIVLKSMIRAIDKLGLSKDDVCMVSGIGCSSRLTGYVDFNTLHTTHGRALTFATGIKIEGILCGVVLGVLGMMKSFKNEWLILRENADSAISHVQHRA